MTLKSCKTVFNALADETRIRILNLLGRGELCVCDLMRILKEPQSKISRHLAYLRRAGLVEARKEALWMHYRLSKTGTRIFRAVIGVLSRARSESGELRRDFRELRKNKNCLVACCKC